MSRVPQHPSIAKLDDLLNVISPFLGPPLEALRAGDVFDRSWKPRDPWG